MKTTECKKCNNQFTNNNYKRHVESCNGKYIRFVKSNECKYCKKDWSYLEISSVSDIRNHIRWCEKNPKIEVYKKDLSSRTKKLSLTTEQSNRKKESISKAWKNGSYKDVDFGCGMRGKTHSEETKEILRKKALASNHRRLRKGMILYKDIWLDSSWEYELAKRLDYLQIKWIRPNSLIWIDTNGIKHNYFPDFYLSDYDIYLDPKNPAAYKNQIEKIKILENTYKNIIFICSLEECKLFNITTPVSPHAYTM